MGTIIVEQFNPGNGYWNKLYEVDEAEFDANAPITVNKYNGQYRTRLIGIPVLEEIIVEKPIKKKFTKKKAKAKFTQIVEDDNEFDQM